MMRFGEVEGAGLYNPAPVTPKKFKDISNYGQ